MKRMIWLILIMMLPIVSAQMFIQSNGGEVSREGFFAVIKGFFGLTDAISCNPIIRYNATECSYGNNPTQNVTSYDANWNLCCKFGGTCYLDDNINTNQTYLQDDVPCGDKPMEILAITLINVAALGAYIWMAMNWDFTLFSSSGTNKNNAIKGLLIWLIVWIIPMLLQFSIEISDNYSTTADMTTILTTFYTVTIWIAYVISAYFVIFFLYNISIYFNNTIGGKK